MIITRTPFRISLFGGGTDYPIWFNKYGGETLGFTIDKYCYISFRYLPPYFPHKSRIVYSQEEWVHDNKDIEHPAVRETLRYMKINQGVEISHQSDLLARKGLGSSSAFVIGLLNALSTSLEYELKTPHFSQEELAKKAVEIEQDWIKENVGCQDQYLCALGGFNRLKFDSGGVERTSVTPYPELFSHLMLFDTGLSRIASEIVVDQIKQTPHKETELASMRGLVRIALTIQKGGYVENIGKLLHNSWMLKKSLTDKISTPRIDAIYDTALKAGASGGKLLGAGGGGYMLFFVNPELQRGVREALRDLIYVPFKFEPEGSQVIFCDEKVKERSAGGEEIQRLYIK